MFFSLCILVVEYFLTKGVVKIKSASVRLEFLNHLLQFDRYDCGILMVCVCCLCRGIGYQIGLYTLLLSKYCMLLFFLVLC